MSEAAQRYRELMRLLFDARHDGVLDRMDDCWWAMTEREREEADRLLAEARAMASPERLGLVDVVVKRGDGVMPRRLS